jgi:hypothetical protein
MDRHPEVAAKWPSKDTAKVLGPSLFEARRCGAPQGDGTSMAKRDKTEKWAARSARLSAALRENLKRRKAQAKQRELARKPAQGQDVRQETGNETGANSPQAKPESEASPEFRRNPVRE